MKTDGSGRTHRSTDRVEVRGFEPLCRDAEAGLLRAQPAFDLGPHPPAGGLMGAQPQ